MPTQYTKSDTCQFHCVACDECFASLAAFDAHIVHKRGGKVRHRDPRRVKVLRLRTDNGQCKEAWEHRPQTGKLRGVDIWEHGPQTDDARARFSAIGKGKKGS